MGNSRYIQSKKIIGKGDLTYNFLNLCKNEKREYILFLSEIERPTNPNREEILLFPGKTRDANLAQKLFEEIKEIKDFQEKSGKQMLNAD
jgi:hypothetical protein